MSTVIARLIAYLFVGVLCAVGPLLLLIAIVSSIPKVEFVRNSVASDGKIIDLQPMNSRQFSKEVYKPVVRFADDNGQTRLFVADSRSGSFGNPISTTRSSRSDTHPTTGAISPHEWNETIFDLLTIFRVTHQIHCEQSFLVKKSPRNYGCDERSHQQAPPGTQRNGNA